MAGKIDSVTTSDLEAFGASLAADAGTIEGKLAETLGRPAEEGATLEEDDVVPVGPEPVEPDPVLSDDLDPLPVLDEPVYPDPVSPLPVAASGFDVAAALKEIEGMKVGNLRKEYLKQKAIAKGYDEERVALRAEVDKRAVELEAMEKRLKASRTAAPEATIEQTGPYKELLGQYRDELGVTFQNLTSSAGKRQLREGHNGLRKRYRDILKLDGDAFDDGVRDFRGDLEDMFGDDSPDVLKFFKRAARLEIEGERLHAEFETDRGKSSVAVQKQRYAGYVEDLDRAYGGYYNVPDEVKERNPFTLRAFASEMSRVDPKFGGHVKADMKAMRELLAGVEPFDPGDEQWKGMDEDAARDVWIERYDALEKRKAEVLPRVVLDGLMQAKLVPLLLRRNRQLEGEVRRTRVPVPGTNGGGGRSEGGRHDLMTEEGRKAEQREMEEKLRGAMSHLETR